MGERRPDWMTLAVAAFLLSLAAIVAWDAYSLPATAAAYSRIGPRTVPYGVAAILALLGVSTAVEAWRGKFAPREPVELSPVLWVIAGLVAQIALIAPLGFSLATGAVFAFTARAFGRGPLWLSYPVGVAMALAVWLTFAMALKLVLPGGAVERFAMGVVQAVIVAVRTGLGFG